MMIPHRGRGVWAPIAEPDDWSVLEAKIDDIRRMGEALAV